MVECINENPQEKTEFYTKLAGHLPERTVILTDSSTMLPSMFAEATGRPDKYMSLHFGNQIWRNNMTELMRHDGTDPEVFELAAQFAEAIGMVPLKLNREQPGYILNSLLIPWFKAATQLVATGVCDAETVDKCWELATGADPGQTPFRKLDKIGLALARNILSMDPAAKDPASGRPRAWPCSTATLTRARPALPPARASTSTRATTSNASRLTVGRTQPRYVRASKIDALARNVLTCAFLARAFVLEVYQSCNCVHTKVNGDKAKQKGTGEQLGSPAPSKLALPTPGVPPAAG